MGLNIAKNRQGRCRSAKWLMLIWAGLLLVACNNTSSDYMANISSGKPEVATAAMSKAAQEKSRQAIVPLIKRLHDEDPAIRLSAIRALRRITGQDMGYRSYESPVKRAQAIQRWWDWVHQQNIATSQKAQTGD